MMMWRPLRRTSTNPCRTRSAQSSRPEKTRSLPNFYLKPGDKDFRMPAALDLARVSRFQEKFNRLLQVLACIFDGVSLARNIELRAQGHIPIAFALNNRSHLNLTHTAPLPTF